MIKLKLDMPLLIVSFGLISINAFFLFQIVQDAPIGEIAYKIKLMGFLKSFFH